MSKGKACLTPQDQARQYVDAAILVADDCIRDKGEYTTRTVLYVLFSHNDQKMQQFIHKLKLTTGLSLDEWDQRFKTYTVADFVAEVYTHLSVNAPHEKRVASQATPVAAAM